MCSRAIRTAVWLQSSGAILQPACHPEKQVGLSYKKNERALAASVHALKAAVVFYGNKNKAQREVWVCRTFLQNLGVEFDEAHILAAQSDPPDVEYLTARFEIKEIQDPGRRRHDEYKQKLAVAEAATSADQLVTLYRPKDITPAEVCDLVIAEATARQSQYSAHQRSEMDLLCYVNLKHRHFKAGPLPDFGGLENLGWRSINVLDGRRALVLYANETAPEFLKANAGKLSERQE